MRVADYKYDIFCLAEELSRKMYGKEFDELADYQKRLVHRAAELEYADVLAERVDLLRGNTIS